MGILFSKVFESLFGSKEVRILILVSDYQITSFAVGIDELFGL